MHRCKKILKKLFWILLAVVSIAVLLFAYVNLPIKTPQDVYILGTTFSWKYAEALGLDWKEAHDAMYDDLGVRFVRIPVYWDSIEAEMGVYDWERLDYQVARAEEEGAHLTLAIGRKVPRWPECFIPAWAADDTALRQQRLLQFIQTVITRYKSSPAIERWQIENEPFLTFGECPPFDKHFLDKEIATARAADPTRPILLTDSGELGLWLRAAKRGDHFGTTMYRNVYTEKYGAYEYPVGPRFFQLKRQFLKVVPGLERWVVMELQTEPWLPGWITDFTVMEQVEAMPPERLRANVEYARQSGFDEIYTWGVEWWYYLKVQHNESGAWEMMQQLFRESR